MITVSLSLKLATFSPIQRQMSFVVTVSAIFFIYYNLSSLDSLTE